MTWFEYSLAPKRETCWRPSCKNFGCRYPSMCQYGRTDAAEIDEAIEWARPKFYFWLGRDAEGL